MSNRKTLILSNDMSNRKTLTLSNDMSNRKTLILSNDMSNRKTLTLSIDVNYPPLYPFGGATRTVIRSAPLNCWWRTDEA